MGIVRRAGTKDIPRILELLRQVCMVHHLGRPDLFKGPATKYTAQELEELLQDDGRPVFAWVDEEDRLWGYAFCIHRQETGSHVLTDIRTLYLDDLCVDEKARGKQIGTQLYRYVLDYARQTGCYNVTLNVWACNEGAMRFYEKCGMRPQKIGMETIL